MCCLARTDPFRQVGGRGGGRGTGEGGAGGGSDGDVRSFRQAILIFLGGWGGEVGGRGSWGGGGSSANLAGDFSSQRLLYKD